MKKQVKTILILALFSLTLSAAYSQQTSQVAPWASDKGYWVVENNIHDPLNNTVRFYNMENKLVHTEQLAGVKLDINKRKTKMKLKKALEATIGLYKQHQEPAAIRDYVVKILK